MHSNNLLFSSLNLLLCGIVVAVAIVFAKVPYYALVVVVFVDNTACLLCGGSKLFAS